MKEAMLYSQEADNMVRCQLCAHRCTIAPGKSGVCGVRENREGKLYTLVYDKVIASHVDPIEKKPLYQVLPGSLSYSIATVGCNFHCLHCQNHDIALLPREYPGHIPGTQTSPEQIVAAAQQTQCASIAYTYTEPTIYFELAYDTAKLAHEQGLKNVFVTNGYMTPEALDLMQPYLDAANVDLKGFDDAKYRQVCGGKLEPVQTSIVRMRELGIWVEVTTLVIPTHNDSDEELRAIAEWIASVDAAMPWHISAFYPQYKMSHLPPTPADTIFRAVELGKAAGLRYVYSGNIRGSENDNTHCYQCGERVVTRRGFGVTSNRLVNGACPACQTPIDGIFA